MFNIPSLFLPNPDWPEEPVKTTFITVLQQTQAKLFEGIDPSYYPVPPGKEIEVLRLVATSYKIAADLVTPSSTATNGTPK